MRAARRSLVALAVGIASLTLTVPVRAAGGDEGDLDLGYDGDGLFSPGSGTDMYGISDVALQPDGKIVTAQGEGPIGGWTVARYLLDGGVDEDFGDGGKVVVEGQGGTFRVHAVAVQADGKIVSVGEAWVGDDTAIAVVRHLADGSLDQSFGIRLKSVGTSGQRANDVVIQPDGKILVAGYTTFANEDHVWLRYDSDGGLDGDFGVGGVAQMDVGSAEAAEGVALQANGQIVTSGWATIDGRKWLAVTRLHANGSTDDDFGFQGRILLPGGTTAGSGTSAAVQADGGLLLAGSATSATEDGLVTRLLATGYEDSEYGTAAQWKLDLGDTEVVESIALQPDGKAVVVAYSWSSVSRARVVVARITAEGESDATFGDNGRRIIDLGDPDYGLFMRGLALRPDGRIVVGGTTAHKDSGDGVAMLARLLGDKTAPSNTDIGVLASAPPFQLRRTLTWPASQDDHTGVQGYVVERRGAKATDKQLGAWATLTSTASTSTAFTGKPGTTNCFRVRAKDVAGNLGETTSELCLVFPVDDRAAVAAGSWAKATGSSYYRGTVLRSTSKGASLTVQASYRTLGLVATTCPTCGTVKVYRGQTLLKTVSLTSAKVVHRRYVAVSALATVATGKIRIVQASAGKKVLIDGIHVGLNSTVS